MRSERTSQPGAEEASPWPSAFSFDYIINERVDRFCLPILCIAYRKYKLLKADEDEYINLVKEKIEETKNRLDVVDEGLGIARALDQEGSADSRSDERKDKDGHDLRNDTKKNSESDAAALRYAIKSYMEISEKKNDDVGCWEHFKEWWRNLSCRRYMRGRGYNRV